MLGWAFGENGVIYMFIKALAEQPRSFFLVFFVEIWERFGYYGVQSLIVLYMVQQLGYSDVRADLFFASFTALLTLLPCLGGYVGDKLLGTKRTILLGSFILALGYFLLGTRYVPSAWLGFPLSVIAIGHGLFKANPSSLLSKIYERTGHHPDTGFTLYYMAINIGSLSAASLAPLLNKYFGWHAAFLSCFVGLVLAILNYALMRKSVSGVGSLPDSKPIRKDYLFYVLFASVLLVIAGTWLIDHHNMMAKLLVFGTVVLLCTYALMMRKATLKERKGMLFFLLLFLQAIVFFVMYFQAPLSIMLFTLRNVRHSLFGFPIEPAQFYAFNGFWIVFMSFVLAMLYQHLAKKKRDFSLPTKFAWGVLFTSFGFLALFVSGFFAHDGVVSGGWVVTYYWLQSTGELLVSALGMSLAAQYVPQRFMGFSMGLWFLSVSIASMLAGMLASVASVPQTISDNPAESLPIYTHFFLQIGLVAGAVGLLMLLTAPLLRRLGNRGLVSG